MLVEGRGIRQRKSPVLGSVRVLNRGLDLPPVRESVLMALGPQWSAALQRQTERQAACGDGKWGASQALARVRYFQYEPTGGGGGLRRGLRCVCDLDTLRRKFRGPSGKVRG